MPIKAVQQFMLGTVLNNEARPGIRCKNEEVPGTMRSSCAAL